MRCRYFCKHTGCGSLQKHSIYALIDIRTQTPFYLGETLTPIRRLREHVRNSFHPVLPKYIKQVYIRHLIENGLYPQMVILDSIESDCKAEVHDAESAYVSLFYQAGILVATGGFEDNGTVATALPEYIDREIETFNFLREIFLWD